ncbi:LysR family transcriptional regulator [Trinickia mobilis]|uniref:LysR family transcriptional regulator n=1 Tax=Trinickia mobilis TaxID=2816356 RepID=UPI001A8F2679|nr:LysR family transcriptional regulator [Trinickia mobilis]
MQDRFEDMRTFVAVVERRSFAAAAIRVGVVRSAVSRRIDELESRLGIQLLNRSTRTIGVTSVGFEFYERAVALLADLDEAESVARKKDNQLVGHLRVNAPMSFGTICLAPILGEFSKHYPQLTIDLVLDDRLVDIIGEGFDVAIRVAALKDSNLVASKIATVNRTLCASPAYLGVFGHPCSIDELAGHRALTYSNVEERQFWRLQNVTTGEESIAPVRTCMWSNSGDALRELAIASCGITVLPDFIIRGDLDAKRLVPILPDCKKCGTSLYAIYPTRRNLSSKTRAFIDFLQSNFEDAVNLGDVQTPRALETDRT